MVDTKINYFQITAATFQIFFNRKFNCFYWCFVPCFNCQKQVLLVWNGASWDVQQTVLKGLITCTVRTPQSRPRSGALAALQCDDLWMSNFVPSLSSGPHTCTRLLHLVYIWHRKNWLNTKSTTILCQWPSYL